MKNISHADSCSVGSSVDAVKVSVTFRGAHTGSFEVERNGNILPPNADGTVSVGAASTLRGSSILVTTLVTRIGPGTLFEVDYVVQGAMGGPFTVQDSFASNDPDVTLEQTITFN